MKYEVALIREDGTLCRGGIPTSKCHAQRWANENNRMYPDEKFVVVEYEAQQEPVEIELEDHVPGMVIDPPEIPDRGNLDDFEL